MFGNKKLVFNGFQAEELGFIVVEGAPEILAQEDYEVVTVEGRNGSLVVNKGTYPDIERPFTITAIDYIDDDDIEGMIDSIKKWFFDITDNRLFYAFSNKYHIVKKVIFNEDIRTSFEQFGDFQVTFLCEPFYYVEENPVIINKSKTGNTTFTYTNDGDFESYPNIKVYGLGDVRFILNDEPIKINNITNFVEIDTKLFLCLDPEGNNKIDDLLVDFPTLQRGRNTIVIPEGQSITKIEVIPRTIYR